MGAGEPLAQILGKRAPEIGPSRLDARDAPPVEHAGEPADGGLDFGKLGHGAVIARSGATKQSSTRRLDGFAALAMRLGGG